MEFLLGISSACVHINLCVAVPEESLGSADIACCQPDKRTDTQDTVAGAGAGVEAVALAVAVESYV